MAPFSLTLKHAGKAYPLPDFDPSNSALAFKDQIYHLTGVPADKVKVPVKGGMLKVRCIHPRLLPAPAPTAHPLSPRRRAGRRRPLQARLQACASFLPHPAPPHPLTTPLARRAKPSWSVSASPPSLSFSAS